MKSNRITANSLLLTLLLLVVINIFFNSCNNETDNAKLQQQVDSLHHIIKQYNQGDSMKSFSSSSKIAEDNFSSQKNKISPQQVIAILEKNTDVIPIEPVLGGKMFFTKIKVLNDRWLYTEYEDGHIDGSALYEYQQNTAGDLQFILLSQSTDD